MDNKPLLSIAIPTYNRADFLKNLLNCIAPQAKESGLVQICISNNSSTDNTREVVINFIEKYPGIIEYSENEKNLGYDANFLKVMEMSQGDFVWLFGDDDSVVVNGVKKVIDFIKNCSNKDTGLIVLANSLYIIDSKTGKKIIYDDAMERNRNEVFKMNREDIVGGCFISSVFMSIFLFNNHFLKKTLEEERIMIEKAKKHNFMHTFLYRLMFLKYTNLEALKLNEIMVETDLHYYKIYIEDIFKLYYIDVSKLDSLLLSGEYGNDYYKKMFINNKKRARKDFIIGMGVKKAFKALNYSSFLGCIKMFFQNATFKDALLFSLFFIIFFIVPSIVLKNLYKIFIKVRLKNDWEKFWLATTMKNSEMDKGNRRLIC